MHFLTSLVLGSLLATAALKTPCEMSLSPATSEAARVFVFSYMKAEPSDAVSSRPGRAEVASELALRFENEELRPFLKAELPRLFHRLKITRLATMNSVIVAFPRESVPSLRALKAIERRRPKTVDRIEVIDSGTENF